MSGRFPLAASGVLILTAALAPHALGQDQQEIDTLIRQLNDIDSIRVTQPNKSFTIIFDAFLDVTEPPFPIGEDFNQNTIHPDMNGWDQVSSWAEANPQMAQALLDGQSKRAFGMPYGREQVAAVNPVYPERGLFVDIAVGGDLRETDFAYLDAIRTISALATAEVYRLLETGETNNGFELAVAHINVLRQVADRDFLAEKTFSIDMLSTALQNLREMLYRYYKDSDADTLRDLSMREIAFIQVGRNRLLIPEADRKVAEALLRHVFDPNTGVAEGERFARTFAAIQSEDKPLTRFGAARRWMNIAAIHSSLDASLERLQLVYDDWWRRWRLPPHDPLLERESEYVRTNPVRYAAVVHAARDMELLFNARNLLIMELNGTAVAAGLCSHAMRFNGFPRDIEQAYAQSLPKRMDVDIFSESEVPFRYRPPGSRTTIETPWGRLSIESNQCQLYCRGQDGVDDGGQVHREGGVGIGGDVILWPPPEALAREAGMLN